MRGTSEEAGGFVGKEPRFHFEASGEAGQFSIRADDAMAGHDDGERVSTIRGTDGTDGGRLADLAGDPCVALGLAEGDQCEGVPDLLLEPGAFRGERDGEFAKFSGEVGAKLALGFHEDGVCGIFLRLIERDALRGIIFPENGSQSAVAGDECQQADGRWHRFREVRCGFHGPKMPYFRRSAGRFRTWM